MPSLRKRVWVKVKLDSPLVSVDLPGETSHIGLIHVTGKCMRVLGVLKHLREQVREREKKKDTEALALPFSIFSKMLFLQM
jgi:hypothetical protein